MEVSESDFPPVETVSREQVAATHRQMQVAPPGQPQLAFNLSLPSDWASDAQSASPGDCGAWTPLAVFAAKSSSRGAPPQYWATVAVLWRRCEFEVPLHEWA